MKIQIVSGVIGNNTVIPLTCDNELPTSVRNNGRRFFHARNPGKYAATFRECPPGSPSPLLHERKIFLDRLNRLSFRGSNENI